mgnify:FL=1
MLLDEYKELSPFMHVKIISWKSIQNVMKRPPNIHKDTNYRQQAPQSWKNCQEITVYIHDVHKYAIPPTSFVLMYRKYSLKADWIYTWNNKDFFPELLIWKQLRRRQSMTVQYKTVHTEV